MSQNSTQNVLNVSPLLFDDADVEVGILQFSSSEERDAALKRLRQQHCMRHVFRRDGKQSLLTLPIGRGESVLGDEQKTIRLSSNLGLCAVLMREALLNFRIRRRLLTRGYHPLEFLGTGAKDDLLGKALARVPGVDESLARGWLSIKANYELDIRVFELESRAPFLGMAVGISSHWRILPTARTLMKSNFPLQDFYVGTYEDDRDPRLEPRFCLQGRVCGESEDLSSLSLADGRDGRTDLDSETAFLDSNRAAIQSCLAFLFGHRASAVQSALDKEISSLLTGPGRLEKMRGLVLRLQGCDLELMPDVPISVGELMSQQDGTLSKVKTAPRAVYIFDALGEKTDIWHERGLRNSGPYSNDTFTPNRPRICVVCQKRKRGDVDVFLQQLLHGLRPVTPAEAEKARFAKGLIGLYHLEKVVPEVFEATDDSAKAYRRAANEAIAAGSDRKWDLALVQTDEQFHNRFGDDNPYLITKAAFLMQGILTQEFEIETARLPRYQLANALNNIALASYAKLDGTPWVLQANRSITHELVIGMGSASIGQGRLGRRERVVGITTVFSNFGTYYLHNVSRAVSMDEFEEVLLDSLKRTINEVRKAHNWQPRQAVRLIFHGFKPMKDEQVHAVKGLMETLGDFDVSYAFLHIIQDHPYVLFDEAQLGVSNNYGTISKGAFAPLRGQYLLLSGSEVLLSLTGAKEVLQAEHGIPRPILLRLHRGSSFSDLTYLARQVYFFASHSWRAFTPSALPVTVDYSRMMARLLGQLDTTSIWRSDVLIGRTGSRRWFL